MNIFERKLHPDANIGGGGDDLDKKIEAEEATYKELLSRISNGYVDSAEELLQSFPLPQEKVEEATYKGLLYLLSNDNTDKAKELLQSFPLPQERLNTPEIQEATYKGLIYLLSNDNTDKAKELLQYYPLPQERLNTPEIQEATYKGLISLLSNGNNDKAKELLQSFPLPQEKVEEATYKGLLSLLSNGNNDKAEKLLQSFPLPQEKVEEATYKGLISLLSNGHVDYAEKLLQYYPLPQERLNTPEIQEATYKGILFLISKGYAGVAEKLLQSFPLPQEKVEEATYKGLLSMIPEGYVDSAKELLQSFPLPQEKVEEATYQGLLSLLSNGNNGSAEKLLQYFPLPQEKVEEATYQGLLSLLSNGNNGSAEKLLQSFPLPQERLNTPEIQEATYEGLLYLLSNDNTDKAKELLQYYPLPQERLNTPEIQEATYKRLLYLLSNDNTDKAKELLQYYPLPQSKFVELFKQHNGNILVQIFAQQNTGITLDKKIKKAVDIFGLATDTEAYEMVISIMDAENLDNIPDSVRAVGVKNTGDTGINQLEQWFGKFKKDIIGQDFDPEMLLNNKFANKFFRNYIRFEKSQWKGEGHDFDFIVQRYIGVDKSGKFDIELLPKEYVSSGIISIDKVSKEVDKEFKYSESFINRFTLLVSDIKKAKDRYLASDRNTLSGIATDLKSILDVEVASLKGRILNVPEKGRGFLEKRIQALEVVDVRSVKDFQNNYKLLSNIKGTENLLRQAVFAYTYSKNKTMLEYDLNNLEKNKRPNVDDVSWILNFIDHITNEETFADYFTDKEAGKEFERTINTRALSEELSRMQNQDTTGTTTMQFIPTRGILMEFSGHMADACWADKYKDTIPATYPNFASVSMIQNPGTTDERIAGSCMLIEADSTNGGPVLIIRGLNPLEGVINGLKISDFYKKYIEYLKGIAKARKRKLAIVIDGNSGGSSTNRPLLFQYLSGLELKKIKVPYDETEFNGYDVTSCTYLVE